MTLSAWSDSPFPASVAVELSCQQSSHDPIFGPTPFSALTPFSAHFRPDPVFSLPFSAFNEILATMLARFDAVLTPRLQARMFELGLDTRQLVTLASIIEKEAKLPAERSLIASVFYNRLAAGMPLQSDPTALYNFAGESERAVSAVRTASAFNTYVIAGLPPGPIANPGLPSIQAALYPAHTDYLYFVARHDGSHLFSRSFHDHRHAIDEIRRTAAVR